MASAFSLASPGVETTWTPPLKSIFKSSLPSSARMDLGFNYNSLTFRQAREGVIKFSADWATVPLGTATPASQRVVLLGIRVCSWEEENARLTCLKIHSSLFDFLAKKYFSKKAETGRIGVHRKNRSVKTFQEYIPASVLNIGLIPKIKKLIRVFL